MEASAPQPAFSFRHFAPDADIARLAQLLADVEAADHDGEDTSEAMLREQLAWPNHDPVLDRVVVEDPAGDGRIIGYGSTWAQTAERAELYVATHPAWRRRGLGAALLARALDRARDLGISHVAIHANAQHAASNAFLTRHGFWPVGAFRDLALAADAPIAEPSWPQGYTLRTYAELLDVALLVYALNQCYAGMWGHRETTEAQVGRWLPQRRPEDILLAFGPDGDVAGYCQLRRAASPAPGGDAPLGTIDAPGVALAHRDRQLQRPLLLSALGRLRAHGAGIVGLESWGDDEPTVAIYRAIGFAPLRHFISYRLDVI